MLIYEVADPDIARLAALTQFLVRRVSDTGAKKPFSVQSFIDLAGNLGISLTDEKFREMSRTPPLNGMIGNIEGDNIIWADQESQPGTTMPVDQARDIVAGMAKKQAQQAFQ